MRLHSSTILFRKESKIIIYKLQQKLDLHCQDQNGLANTEMQTLRNIVGAFSRDHIHSQEVRRLCSIETIGNWVVRIVMNGTCTICRMAEHRLAKIVREETPTGSTQGDKRRHGGTHGNKQAVKPSEEEEQTSIKSLLHLSFHLFACYRLSSVFPRNTARL